MLMAWGLWFFATFTARPRPISNPVPAATAEEVDSDLVVLSAEA
jgi:hypothetical protein